MLRAKFTDIWKAFEADNLFRNSIYLMLTTGVMGGLGFFYWLICTHIFTPEQIGVGTTLISAMTLISFTSLLGLNSTLVRILPTSKNRNREINTSSILVLIATILIAIAYVYIIPYITPSLGILKENIWYSIGFIIIVALASLNSLTDSIFIAYRSAHYALITDGIVTGVAKLVLPFVFITAGAYGVFASSGLAVSLGMIASIFFLITKFEYIPQLSIDIPTLKKMFRYSFANYLSNLLAIIPSLVLPIIIIGRLGPAAAGYFYLAFMVSNLLYTVSSSISQSLFAEGSYSESSLLPLIKRAALFIVVIMIPAAAVLAIAGPYVLIIFGKSYSASAAGVIAVLALAAPAVAANNITGVILRIRHHNLSLIVTDAIYTLTVVSLTFYWIDRGIVWVAAAWMVGNAISALLACIPIFALRGQATPSTI